MARVCTDTLVNEKNPDRSGFSMDDVLKSNLDILIKNAVHDWDFSIIVSGGGRVRVGKSLLALQIAYYWTDQMKKIHNIEVPFNVKDNIVFTGADLISKGNYLGTNHPYSCLIFDEAGADLEGVKAMKTATQNVKDFLRECGQYNLLTILVLPEFFDLPKSIALSRTDVLIDVFTLAGKDELFERGFFNFYARDSKKKLYLFGKKTLDYKAHKYDFHGRFYNNYPINEEEYRKAKLEALKKREQTPVQEKYLSQRNKLFIILNKLGYSLTKISELMREQRVIITSQAIGKAIETEKAENTNLIVYNSDEVGGEVDEPAEE